MILNTLKIYKKNLLTGYGPQADRQLMYNKSKIDEAPAILGHLDIMPQMELFIA